MIFGGNPIFKKRVLVLLSVSIGLGFVLIGWITFKPVELNSGRKKNPTAAWSKWTANHRALHGPALNASLVHPHIPEGEN